MGGCTSHQGDVVNPHKAAQGHSIIQGRDGAIDREVRFYERQTSYHSMTCKENAAHGHPSPPNFDTNAQHVMKLNKFAKDVGRRPMDLLGRVALMRVCMDLRWT
mmetsp:Transcript_51769/g.120766  ORF Transcript_51769/g.120766 Transcript_51769/m.120766 type:complete len:104 (-) Transcript_51769:344-655(-)